LNKKIRRELQMGERHEKCQHTGGVRFLKIIGGITIAVVALGILTQINDIRRYIKISTM